ncbi:Mitochondrial intermediate peptidase [Cardamine amara subsp. amara]|uniref:Mitochondrial intermediate peptidase n=1 Tax=Cardamine amara subsp. amara TaxID=228776 RepID=A0ABD1BYD7_CARAN
MWKLTRRVQPHINSTRWLIRNFRSGESGDATGLYGFDQLKTAKGFQRFVADAIERSGELVNYVSGMPSSPEIVKAMDEISDTVCRVVDSAELCRQTHPDKEFVEEATKAAVAMNEYLHNLNTNHTLYAALKKAEQDSNLLTKEASRTAQNLRMDLERSGIHLDRDKLDRVSNLTAKIFQLTREFSENIADDPGHVDIFPVSRIPRHLHRNLKPIYRSASRVSRGSTRSTHNSKEKGLRITTDTRTLSSILQLTPDEEVRKRVYIQGNSVPHANHGVLENLIAARHEFAQIVGYNSYSDYEVGHNLAKSPKVVTSFLEELSKTVKPKAEEEFIAIRDFKRKKSGNKSAELEPWDETYYTSMMKSSVNDVDTAVVASYFPLPQCIEGLKVLVESLFGATFHTVPLAPGESWHPDVLKLSLHHPDEGDLGYLYLDLYSRKGKYPTCACFAIKGGRKISETEYQLPLLALVCNFSRDGDSSVVKLNHSEVEVLFHEFGHALHSLLSRTDYQHFSGSRMAIDLAELPSNLFEYYAWDYRLLKRFARHYSTGEIIPEKLVNSLQGARNMFAATEMQRQVLYALIDQMLFGEQPETGRDVSHLVAELKRQHTNWNHVEGTHWHIRFSHLVNYGAGYYTYLYARCFASTIWQSVCEEDSLSLSTGTVLREKFFKHGGAKDPAELLRDVAGNEIISVHDGCIIPATTSLLKELRL